MSTEAVRPFAESGAPEPVMTLVTEKTSFMFHLHDTTWAVAVLNDGTEIRIRHLGDRIEVRGWDPRASMNPPAIEARPGRPHIVDVLPVTRPAPKGGER